MKRKTIVGLVAALVLAAGTSRGAEVRLWRLDCGTIQVRDLGLFSDTFTFAGREKTLTDSCYLIRHDGEYLLWDAGLPASLRQAPPGNGPMSPSLEVTLVEQLARLGVAPRAIAALGLSHAHFDHVGQAASFARAKLLVGQADFDSLTAEPTPFGLEPKLLQPWLTGGAPVEPVRGDKDIYGDGSVVMLAMPGHTPGSSALLVRLAKTGPVLLSGDVAIFREQFETGAVPVFNTDRARSLASMAKLREAAKALRATLVIQHDPDDIGKLPAFPAGAD